jgi:FkbM family methyltransferase
VVSWKKIPKAVLDRTIRPWRWRLRSLVRLLIASRKALGTGEALKLVFYSRVGQLPSELFRLRIPGIQYPVYGRTGTSDPWVFSQIFVEREYAPIDGEQEVRLVFDCGANVGYSSIYFLNRFPHCRVMAVEPDPENVSLLRMNLRPYGDRVEIIPAAVWSTRSTLVMVPQGAAWATQVRAVQRGEKGDLVAVDIPSLLHRAGAPRIDVLKMDIEGSEAEVFSGDVDAWLPHVGTLAIELHGERCTEVVHRALSGYQFQKVISGELSIFLSMKRISRSPAVE